MCNSFSRIIDSFPQIGNRYFELANPSSQIAMYSFESNYPFSRSAIIEIEGTNCNSRERIVLLEWNILFKSRQQIAIRELQFERTDCLIWWNEMQSERTDCLNRGRERIAVRENELSYSRERNNNPWERILNQREQIVQFDITIYLCYAFWKYTCSLMAFRSLTFCVTNKNSKKTDLLLVSKHVENNVTVR